MSTTVIIPSRYGSTRFDGKPLSKIAGKIMIQHVYERCMKAEKVDDVIVATDDMRIVDAVERFGGKAVMTSNDNRSGTDRVAEAAEKICLDDDIIINIQGDQPLINPECINEVAGPFFSELDVEMSTLAYAITREEEIKNPKDVKITFDNNGFALYFSRSPIPFDRDGDISFDTYKHLGVYAYTYRFLKKFRCLPEGKLETIEKLEQLRALEHGHRIRAVVTRYDSPEVDLPEDISRIEDLLKNDAG
ncbi:MAG: 3-deoxy-manno-octulosonate cytidylyltransferase [Deltaproteobacteria bacterium]|nr:3-deoxy-manno-octulosonate cytidylyltransferase [Deltaproteobacteria bacterium]